MARRAFAANPELLLTLAWLASQPHLYKELLATMETNTCATKRVDETMLIQQWLEPEIEQVHQDALYGPIYEQLLRHRLTRIDWDILKWAIQGYGGVYLSEDTLPMRPDREEMTRSETSVLWEAISNHKPLLLHVQRKSQHWQGNLILGSHTLSEHFRLHMPLLIRSTRSSFLIHELLRLSLQRVQWHELAANLLGVPVPDALDTATIEPTREGALQLATLKELVSQLYTDFSAFGWESSFSTELRMLCTDMVDVCQQFHERIRSLERSNGAYDR